MRARKLSENLPIIPAQIPQTPINYIKMERDFTKNDIIKQGRESLFINKMKISEQINKYQQQWQQLIAGN